MYVMNGHCYPNMSSCYTSLTLRLFPSQFRWKAQLEKCASLLYLTLGAKTTSMSNSFKSNWTMHKYVSFKTLSRLTCLCSLFICYTINLTGFTLYLLLQLSEEILLTSSSLVTLIPEQEECSRSSSSGKEDSSLVASIHPHRFTSPRVKKLPPAHKTPKHTTAQVRWNQMSTHSLGWLFLASSYHCEIKKESI